jgi:phage repressor protein C with HTH and peptisase S24 domain
LVVDSHGFRLEFDPTTEGLPAGKGAISVVRWQRVEVSGPSMVPTLRHGDVLLVRRGPRARPGDVVLARFRSGPDRLVVKRAVRATDGGWWLASDNPFAGGDSESHGVADVLARVVFRLAPGWPRRISRVSRRR